MSYKVAINGFGRIGRLFFRASAGNNNFSIEAINDITSVSTLAHLLKYDTVFRKFDGEIEVLKDRLIVNGKEIKVYSERDQRNSPGENWGLIW